MLFCIFLGCFFLLYLHLGPSRFQFLSLWKMFPFPFPPLYATSDKAALRKEIGTFLRKRMKKKERKEEKWKKRRKWSPWAGKRARWKEISFEFVGKSCWSTERKSHNSYSNKAQQANYAFLSISSTFSTLSTPSTLSTFTNVKVGPPWWFSWRKPFIFGV